MSDDKKKNTISELQALNDLAMGLDDFSDPMSNMDIENFKASLGFVSGPKEVALYDTVLVHGMKGDYTLTFEENEDSLVIKVK